MVTQVSIPMAPSLGLYLFELFFDGYNMKQQRDAERDKQAQKKHAEKAKAANSADANTNEGAEEDGDDAQNREEIRWYEDPVISGRLHNFKDTVLHPHIFEEEKRSLAFMWFLDYLRAFPHTYKPRGPATAATSETTAET